LKETLDLPDPIWLRFRRRLAGHISEEARDILASLETGYHELFPHLNLRQWPGFIYHWLM
jgi:hypothetical protein